MTAAKLLFIRTFSDATQSKKSLIFIQTRLQTNIAVLTRFYIPGQAWPAWSGDPVPRGVSGRRPQTLSWNPWQSWALPPPPSRYRQQTNSDRCCKQKWIQDIDRDGFIVTKLMSNQSTYNGPAWPTTGIMNTVTTFMLRIIACVKGNRCYK
jgi:hypothetical protein